MRDIEASRRVRGDTVFPDHHRVVLKSRVSILSGLLRRRFWKKGRKTTLIFCISRGKKYITVHEIVFIHWYTQTITAVEAFLYLYCQTWMYSFQCQLDPGSGFCALCFHPHNKVWLEFLVPEMHSAPSLQLFSMREGCYHHSSDSGWVLR